MTGKLKMLQDTCLGESSLFRAAETGVLMVGKVQDPHNLLQQVISWII